MTLARPSRPRAAATRSTAKVWPVTGTGLNGSGIASCAPSAMSAEPASTRTTFQSSEPGRTTNAMGRTAITSRRLARLPALGAGLALERADDPLGDPAPIELAWLRPGLLVADVAGVHRRAVERDVIADRLVAGLRVVVRPADVLERPVADAQRVIGGEPLPLTDGVARGLGQEVAPDVSYREVEDRRAEGLEDALRLRGVRDRLAVEHDLDALRDRLDARRTRVVANVFRHRDER